MALVNRGTGTRIATASIQSVTTRFDGVEELGTDSGLLGYNMLEDYAQPMLTTVANLDKIPLCWSRGALPLNLWALPQWTPSSLPPADSAAYHIVINNGSFGGFDYEYYYWDAGGWGVQNRLLRAPRLLRIGPAFFAAGANTGQLANMLAFLNSFFTSTLQPAGVSVIYSADQIYGPTHNGYNSQLHQAAPLSGHDAYPDDTRIYNPFRHIPLPNLGAAPLDPGEFGDCNFFRVNQPQFYATIPYASTKYEGHEYLAIAEDLNRQWLFRLDHEEITDSLGLHLGTGVKSVPLIDSTGIASALLIKQRFRKYRVVQVYGTQEATVDVFAGAPLADQPALIAEAQNLQVPAEHAGMEPLGWVFHATATAISFAAWTALIEAQCLDFFDL